MDIEKQLKIIQRGTAEIIPKEELVKKLKKSAAANTPLRIKYGIDPTRPDVHIGHLVPVRKLRTFQDLGHIATVIIGDYTAQIGDPTGKDESRPHLTHKETMANAEKYMEQLYTVLDESRTEVHFQSEWFGDVSLMDTIHLMAKFTFAQIMAHETFRNRYEQNLPLSLHELVYPLLQAYDSVMLKTDVEIGGTDQKFNILLGRDLQQANGQQPQACILFPILIGTDGAQKMSKSLDNYIAVTDTANDMYGKVMSIPDSIIENYYEYATGVSVDELDDIRRKLAEGSVNPRDLKIELAKKIVDQFHPEGSGEKAAEEFVRVFSQKKIPDEIAEYKVPAELLTDGKVWVVKLLSSAGLVSSNAEARRMLQQNAVTIDGEKITDVNLQLGPVDGAVIQVGKRRFIKIAK
jgi:tyrosyl-tRNA synthetase